MNINDKDATHARIPPLPADVAGMVERMRRASMEFGVPSTIAADMLEAQSARIAALEARIAATEFPDRKAMAARIRMQRKELRLMTIEMNGTLATIRKVLDGNYALQRQITAADRLADCVKFACDHTPITTTIANLESDLTAYLATKELK